MIRPAYNGRKSVATINRSAKTNETIIPFLFLLRQVAPGLAGCFGLRGLTLPGLRDAAGLMLSGLPATTGVTADSGLKNTRHPGESCDLFLIMQTVTRSTSGISALQSRNASSLQACCSSGV